MPRKGCGGKRFPCIASNALSEFREVETTYSPSSVLAISAGRPSPSRRTANAERVVLGGSTLFETLTGNAKAGALLAVPTAPSAIAIAHACHKKREIRTPSNQQSCSALQVRYRWVTHRAIKKVRPRESAVFETPVERARNARCQRTRFVTVGTGGEGAPRCCALLGQPHTNDLNFL